MLDSERASVISYKVDSVDSFGTLRVAPFLIKYLIVSVGILNSSAVDNKVSFVTWVGTLA